MGFKVTAYTAIEREVAEEHPYNDEDEFEILDNGVLVVTRPATGEVRYYSAQSWYEVSAMKHPARSVKRRKPA